MNNENLLKLLAIERPVGSEGNDKVLAYVESILKEADYETTSIPFSCITWQSHKSYIKIDEMILEIHANPYSEGVRGTAEIISASNISELKSICCKNKILLLKDELTKSPLQPKNFPFYYPDEHKKIIELLEKEKPLALIAVTGKTVMSGADPFPLFEDGNFTIPSACINYETYKDIIPYIYKQPVEIVIDSLKNSSTSRQIIGLRKSDKSRKKIMLCAHMDSKTNTRAVLDNAMGLIVLLKAAQKLKQTDYNIEIVPFNSEEYFDPVTEIIYLNKIKKDGTQPDLVINIDSPCHINSKIGVSLYNTEDLLKEQIINIINTNDNLELCDKWYAGDHAAFAFQGIKCIAVSSSDLFSGALSNTHSIRDTEKDIDINLIDKAVDFIMSVLQKCRL